MDAAVQWKPLLVCPDAALSSRIRLALSELGAAAGCHLAEYPRMGAIATLTRQQAANVCFLDVASNPEHAMLLIAEAAPAVPVVALHPRHDGDLILRCLRGGASEFLSDPSAEQVAAALEHLRRTRTPPQPRKPTSAIAVVPGKGGSGASTLAVALAVELQRVGKSRVLLVDADPLSASVAFLLKLKPEFHLGDAIRDRLDADLWNHIVTRSNGIDVVPAPENPAAGFDLGRQAAVELFGFWREHYQAVVIDTAGASPAALDFLQFSDSTLLVSTGQVAALYAARRSLEWLEQKGVDLGRVRLILNRHSAANGLARDEVASALGRKPFAVLPEDAGAVDEAVLSGKPVASASRLGRAVRLLAADLAGKAAPPDKKKSLLSLVSLKL
ncbi:MAG TPA: P-loop NTPase [Bryobacteraceae bacterium]|jgi:pilus assembly protein CpaE